MEAIILSAGLGTRLGNLTKDKPKPLLKVNNVPIVIRIIEQFIKHGVKRFHVNTHYHAEKITSLLNSFNRPDIEINVKYEEELSGTAGGVKLFEKDILSDNFFVIYGDILTNENFSRIIDFHRKSSLISFYVHKRKKSNSLVLMDEFGCVSKFLERPSEEQYNDFIKNKGLDYVWVNSGIYLMNKKIFNLIPENKFFDIPKNLFPIILQDKSLYAIPIEGERVAIDSPERLNLANNVF